jgi:hypothetical protein
MVLAVCSIATPKPTIKRDHYYSQAMITMLQALHASKSEPIKPRSISDREMIAPLKVAILATL